MVSLLAERKTEIAEKEERKMGNITIYSAAPLFGIAERAHNLRLANELGLLGYTVILPQEEATRFFKDGKLDLDAVAQNCAKQASRSDVVIANLDGPDADSGTSLEVGIALRQKDITLDRPLVICVRTDFRTAQDQEVGVNGMFKLADENIFKPAFATSIEEIDKFYRELAREIDVVIRSRLTRFK